MDKRKSSKNRDALQLHIDRKKEMMEYDRQALNLAGINPGYPLIKKTLAQGG